MWEPRRLTTLSTFTACYKCSFAFFYFTHSFFLRTRQILVLEGEGEYGWHEVQIGPQSKGTHFEADPPINGELQRRHVLRLQELFP
jgi:hypothetical protein